jgi:hypothetical protein
MNDPANKPQDERSLEGLEKSHPDPRDLSNKVAGTSEETAGLFNSPYKPDSEWGIDPRSA